VNKFCITNINNINKGIDVNFYFTFNNQKIEKSLHFRKTVSEIEIFIALNRLINEYIFEETSKHLDVNYFKKSYCNKEINIEDLPKKIDDDEISKLLRAYN